ncbi:MAG: PAS domain-containing protein [Abitibacteriaceae bacterium]|nr:PAS domain-containing protein [Abditibacteriaceae bacterium]
MKFVSDPSLIVTSLSVLLAIVFCILWRRAQARTTACEQLWRNALGSLADRDYPGARALAAMMEGTARASDLAASLRQSIDALEAEGHDQQRARRELEDVLAALQDAVLMVDRESRVRFFNAAATNLFNVQLENVLGAQLLEALPAFGLESAVRAALQEGKSSAQEVQIYGPDVREVFLRVAPVRQSDGQVTGAVGIVQDLTEMRRLERVRRDFVANASHELRTPIANIRATAETILGSPEDSTLIERFLPSLVVEAERLSRLVTDLLDLARADSSDQIPHDPVDMIAVIYQAVNRLKDRAMQHHVAVNCALQDGSASHVQVLGDAAALEQVVFNLLDNAIVYTPAGGSVTLQVKADAENGHRNGDNTVSLLVSDTGIGIPTGDLPRIFERFYRVDKARSRAQGGTGLGLAIVRHIVENHGGHIKVESEIGQGTTFTVTLPGT